MKKPFSPHRSISLFSLLGAALPVSLLIAGCSGGGDGNSLSPIPTSPPTGSNYNLTGNLSFSNVSAGSSVLTTPITSFSTLNEPGDLFTTTYLGATTQEVILAGVSGPTEGGIRRPFTLNLDTTNNPTVNRVPFAVGQRLTLNDSSQYVQLTEFEGLEAESWRTTSGEAIIRAIGTNSISIELENARFGPTDLSGGRGTFTVNGTLAATGLRVVSRTQP